MLRAPSVRDMGMSMLLLWQDERLFWDFSVRSGLLRFDKSIAYLGITVLSVALMASAGSAVPTKISCCGICFGYIHVSEIRKTLLLDAACVGGAVMVGGLVFLYTYVGAYDILMLC